VAIKKIKKIYVGVISLDDMNRSVDENPMPKDSRDESIENVKPEEVSTSSENEGLQQRTGDTSKKIGGKDATSIESKPSAEEKKQPMGDKEKGVGEKRKKGETVEKKAEKDEFKYIVRLANTDLDGHKKIIHGLTKIKGIGLHMAVFIADTAGVDREMKIGDLSDAQINKIKEVIENLGDKAPGWMVNHRRDYDTGKDIHLVSSDVDMRLREDINLLKMIRSYRGIRHELGLPVRGQRTRSNGRTGLALGVSRKEQRQKK